MTKKYQAKIIIATGQFMNISIDMEIDVEKMEEAKATITAFHRHFYGLLDESEKKDGRY